MLAGKYTVALWTFVGLGCVCWFGISQEVLERKYPSPEEWTWITRKNWRSANFLVEGEGEGGERGVDSGGHVSEWVWVGLCWGWLRERMEDPKLDGEGLREQSIEEEGAREQLGRLMERAGTLGYDVSMKSEPWRRGYYKILREEARAAEHTEGMVKDRTTKVSWRPEVVIGPSNPNPRPVPPWAKDPPLEENCDFDVYKGPEETYLKILSTKGFTAKQRIDAALEYGAWLDFKGRKEDAGDVYRWAVGVASDAVADGKTKGNGKKIVDTDTGVLNTNAGTPSLNILNATTALAVHHALNRELQQALPILVSVLRARRTLQDPPKSMLSTLVPDDDEPSAYQKFAEWVKYILVPAPFPPPPDDGTAPPLRTPKQKCEEAAVMAYIGEIMYASKATKTNREDGLAWTREAVDLAEEELRRRGLDAEAKKTCRECLGVGLENWTAMVRQMAREEKEASEGASSSVSWLGFGGKGKEDVVGRWESEEQVIKERVRRVEGILGKGDLSGMIGSNSSFLSV